MRINAMLASHAPGLSLDGKCSLAPLVFVVLIAASFVMVYLTTVLGTI